MKSNELKPSKIKCSTKNDDFKKKLLEERDKYQPFQRRRTLKQHILNYAEEMDCHPEQWTAMMVVQFVWNYEKFRKDTVLSHTINEKFRVLGKVFQDNGWTENYRKNLTFSDLKAVYMRKRKDWLPGTEEKTVKQANPISQETAASVVTYLLSCKDNTEWQRQFRLVRILALVFSVTGGCRIKDLYHIKWGNIEVINVHGHSVVFAKLDRSKTDPEGLKENFRIFPETKNSSKIGQVGTKL